MNLTRALRHPARLVPLGFLCAVLIGTGLLMLPAARVGEEGAPLLVALFTATSAVCVTGLVVVDTPTYWSGLGQAIILVLFQVGGFGIMTGATLLTLAVTRQLGLSTRLVAKAETKSADLGDVLGVLRVIVVVTLVTEVGVALVLHAWLTVAYGVPPAEAAWHAVFQSVSAFNNAGFSTYSDSLMQFSRDPVVMLPLMVAVILGGLGFPVIHELMRRSRAGWSVHTRITMFGTALLLVLGTVGTLAYEWHNVLGEFDLAGKLLNAASHSVMSRTAGFNSIDIGSMEPTTLLMTYGLMLIGGGSAGTAGGIKVTTFFLLAFVVWAEIRGQRDTEAFGRRISQETQRQAVTVVLLSASAVGLGALIVASTSDFPLDQVIFEVISAFATVGLSTGITADLPPAAMLTIIVLMFIGRVGTIAVATALALRRHDRPFRYPEERPIVG